MSLEHERGSPLGAKRTAKRRSRPAAALGRAESRSRSPEAPQQQPLDLLLFEESFLEPFFFDAFADPTAVCGSAGASVALVSCGSGTLAGTCAENVVGAVGAAGGGGAVPASIALISSCESGTPEASCAKRSCEMGYCCPLMVAYVPTPCGAYMLMGFDMGTADDPPWKYICWGTAVEPPCMYVTFGNGAEGS